MNREVHAGILWEPGGETPPGHPTRQHREQVTGDFSLEEYLALQRLVWQVGEALRQEVPTERLYVLSLGSQQGNRHVHWHLAPLPPGVAYRDQQFAAFDAAMGIVALSAGEEAELAERLAARLRRQS